MPIPERISDVIATRQARVDGIRKKLEKLKLLRDEITEYEQLRNRIIDSHGNLRDDSPYAPMLLKHPDMVKKIASSTALTLKMTIDDYDTELKRLQHIYSRDSISIQVFGFAGAGKSTLIQTVTGLGNDVVMATDDRMEGRHCTGACSFIYNATSFEARVYFYTKEELLKTFNENFLRLQKKHCNYNSTYQLMNFAEIASFQPADYGLPAEVTSSLIIFKRFFQLIDRLTSRLNADGTPMVLSTDPDGNYYLKLTQPTQVQQYVAQFNGRSGTEFVEYYNYLAVKRVDVFTHFPNSETAGKIVLMDNVGLGDETNQQTTENTMYESIAANSDAVVFLFCPEVGGGWVAKQAEILKAVRNMRTKDFATREERMDVNQLFMLVNKKVTSKSDNSAECLAFQNWFKSKDEIHGGQRDETCIIVNAKNLEETSYCLEQVLTQMTDHLPEIDCRMETKMAQAEDAFLTEFKNFIRELNSVTLVNDGGNKIINFETRFRELYTHRLRKSLLDMLQEAKDCENEVSSDLNRQLRTRCTSEKAEAWVNKTDPLIDRQLEIHAHPVIAYLNMGAHLRHAIPNDFRKVDTDLQHKIDIRKAATFDILFSVGRLSALLQKDKRCMDAVAGTLDWAHRFVDLFLEKENYPLLYKLFVDLLTFNQNVDGFLLPKVIKHLDKFYENQPSNLILGQEKKIIRYYLETNLIDSFEEIRKELDNFVQTPNEAVYFALDEFAYGMIYCDEVEKEARKLYANFYETVWEKEVEGEQAQDFAFEEWTTQKMRLVAIKDYFENV